MNNSNDSLATLRHELQFLDQGGYRRPVIAAASVLHGNVRFVATPAPGHRFALACAHVPGSRHSAVRSAEFRRWGTLE